MKSFGCPALLLGAILSVALSMRILYMAYQVACDQKERQGPFGVHMVVQNVLWPKAIMLLFAGLLESISSVLMGGDSHRRLDLVSIANVFAPEVPLQVQVMC